jgi:hypothetical protein
MKIAPRTALAAIPGGGSVPLRRPGRSPSPRATTENPRARTKSDKARKIPNRLDFTVLKNKEKSWQSRVEWKAGPFSGGALTVPKGLL